MGQKKELCVIFSTVPAADAAVLSRMLVDQRLAACVNAVPVRSYYRWNGEICDEEEQLLMIKTRSEKAVEVIATIKAQHPYAVPEIIALPVIEGYTPYIEWVYRETLE
jgi:periplasmic divalent cation tolerance protein